jgi:nucleoside-diphosphate-sugar epimerase
MPELLSNERWLYTNLAEPVDPDLLASGKVLCHLAYSMVAGHENIDHNRRLLDAVNTSPNIERVILTSSVSVYGANNIPVVDEESACNPVGEYATSKLACEMVWREGLREDCVLTVLRPSSIIGPGSLALHTLVQDALDRPLIGAIKRSVLYHHPVHFVSIDNVVAAILFCLRHPQETAQETYIISNDEHPENKSYAAMQDTVRKLSGQRPLPGIALPRRVLRLLAAIASRPLGIAGPPLGLEQTLSSRKIREAGFEDVTSLHTEVARVVEDLRRAV